jgi:hypothetical protein
MDTFAEMNLDYAIFPGTGLVTMGLKEAAECARLTAGMVGLSPRYNGRYVLQKYA